MESIANRDWIQRWAGSYTFISASYWGPQYHLILEKLLGKGIDHTLFIHKAGTVSFFIPRKDLDAFGKHVADIAINDAQRRSELLSRIKENTDLLVPMMEILQTRIPTWEEYRRFLTPFENHLAYHNFMKKTVDYLPPNKLEELLLEFTHARKYSERVYSDTERFFRAVMKKIGEKEGRDARYLTCLTQTEFEAYLKDGTLPEEKELLERYEQSALYFANGKERLIKGADVTLLEKLMLEDKKRHSTELKGVVAYRGKIRGVARVVPDPFAVKTFNEGDILVTGMTRPEFVPLMKKAAAIVTDAGGALCHAAISARELKKPCVVGTEIATKAIKTGDLIEVDAQEGVVRIIERGPS